MTGADLLRSLGVDPSQLDPPHHGHRQGRRRAARRQPSVRALRQARQSDRGRRHTRAWPPLAGPMHALPHRHHPTRRRPRAPLADTLAVLREAAREAGVDLTIVADES